MKYFNLIIVCLSLFSCTSEFSKGKYVIDTIHPVITLDRYEKEFDLQDFIENISYCKLETSPESLLGNIDKMMVDSSSLFIFDRYTCNALYRFSRSGKFITKFGKQGRGVCDHFGLTDEIDLIMGTFSKSLASIGGFIAADESIINWLRHNARTYIFSASNTPAATASALEALHIIQNEPERLEALWEATNYALKRFREAGFEIGATESPIIPLYVRDTEKTFMVTKLAFDEGVFINPVIPPACAPQDTLVRVALMATHTKEQIDSAVDKLVKCFKELEII